MLAPLERLRTWYKAQDCRSVRMVEEPQDRGEAFDEINVVSKVRFVPLQPTMLHVEVWITDQGHFGIGIETFARLAILIGRQTSKDRFVAGFLPLRSEFAEISHVLEAVARAEFVIDCRVLPLLGFSATAKIAAARSRELGTNSWDLQPGILRPWHFPGGQRLLFEPWS